MVRTRREKKAAAEVKLAQPDRSAPSEQTLLDMALERNLFEQADQHPTNRRKREEGHDDADGDGELSPTAERVMDALLWTVSLAMLHFTLDVLVQHQYAMEIVWPQIATRALTALAGKTRHAVVQCHGCHLFEADRDRDSFLRLLLRAPSTPLIPRPASRSPAAIPGPSSTSHILRCEHRLRLLPD